jgi:hypothetical protein
MKRLLTIFLSVLLMIPAHTFTAEGQSPSQFTELTSDPVVTNPAANQGATNGGFGAAWLGAGAAIIALGAYVLNYLKGKGFLKGLNIGPVATTREKPQPIAKEAEEQARRALVEKYMRVVRKLSNIANTDDEIVMAKMNPETAQEIADNESKLSDAMEQRYRYTIAEEYAKKYPNKKLNIMDIPYFSKVQDDKFREKYFRAMIVYYRSIIRNYGSDDAKNKMEKLFGEENVQFNNGKLANEMPAIIGED